MRHPRRCWAWAVLVVLGLAGTGQAALMSDLTVPGASITADGRTYSNFTYSSATLAANQVTVTPISNGLRFSANWNTTVAGIVDTTIGYDVTTLPGAPALAGVWLTWSGAAAQNGAVASVGEQVQDLMAAQQLNLQVLTDGAGPLTDTSSDFGVLAPTGHIHVVKDINVSISTQVPEGVVSSASITSVDNTYTPVPEPASLGMLVVGAVGVCWRRGWKGGERRSPEFIIKN